VLVGADVGVAVTVVGAAAELVLLTAVGVAVVAVAAVVAVEAAVVDEPGGAPLRYCAASAETVVAVRA